MKNIYRIFCLLFLLIGLIGASTPSTKSINLFILSFDNYHADPEIDWLKEGFVDFLMDYFANKPGLNVRRITEIETLTEQIKTRPEFKSVNNYVLTGNFQRNNEQFEIDLQLTDINSWKIIEKKKISETTADLAKIIESVNLTAAQIVGLYLPEKSIIATAPESTPMPETKSNPFQETVAATKQISFAIDRLSNLYPSQPKSPDPTSRFKDVPGNEFARKWSESITQTDNFQDILYRIVRNPYKLEISDPLFRALPLNEDLVKVTFRIRYILNRELIQEMLETFSYKSRTENEEFTEYTFAERFAFQNDLLKAIARGDLRLHPVISFITDEGTIAGAIIDASTTFSKDIKSSPKVQFIAKYQPLINLTASAWSVKIQLKNINTEIEYSLDLNLEQLKRIDRIDILFLSDTDILEYLKTVK